MTTSITNLEIILNNKHTVKDLKVLAKAHKIKQFSKLKKTQLQERLFLYIKKTRSASIIQVKLFKRYILNKIFKLQGPARLQRGICVNTTDFYDLDKLTDLDWVNFISFKDSNNLIFGFSLKSLYNLFKQNIKDEKDTHNPYNTTKLPEYLYVNLIELIRLCKVIHIPIDIIHDTNSYIIDSKTKVRELFNKIDELGNYSDANWLLQLSKPQLLQYLKELKDIFFYRANINAIRRFLICPFHNGDPFYDTSLSVLQFKSYEYVLNKTIAIIKRFIMYSSSYEYNKLGSLYVLIALTLVSEDARIALPELYYSVNLTN